MSRVAHPAGPRHADVLPADHPPAPPADLNALHPAIWPRGAQRRGGVLTLGGVDVRDLAGEFGTPVFVTDEQDVRDRCREYVESFCGDRGDLAPGGGSPEAQVFYAASWRPRCPPGSTRP
jgi:diaminopimelate decarboxylase